MASIKSIIKKHNLKDIEIFATALKYAGREENFTKLFKAASFDDAIEKLKWELSSITFVEIDLKEMRFGKDNWDSLQRNTYNIQLADLNKRKRKLDEALVSLIIN